MTSRFHRLIAWTLLPACLAALSAVPAPAQPAPPVQLAAKADPENCLYTATLEAFFPGPAKGGGPKNLNLYMARREGRWVAALGTPTVLGKPVWNTALMLVDPAGLAAKNGKLAGTVIVTLVLYQLTGDKKYADFARQCVEKAWAGQRDADDRYSWVAPGGELRAGPSVGWYAAAYDLCYDAWDDAFRRKVALAIQNYDGHGGGEWNKPEEITLGKMVLTPKQGPGSNHFGAVVGGCGLAVLAITGDPGADNDLLDKYASILERQVMRHLSAGWGDGGYYKEGWGASTVGTQAGFLCFLQALKTAAGHDFLNVDRPNASSVTLVPRCLMLIGPPAVLPYRSNMGGTYGSAEFHRERAGFSHGGHFSEGFGAIADRFKPALLWTYNHVVEPDAVQRDFDTPSLYPHRPML